MRLLQEIPEVSILKKLRIARYGYILMSVVFYAAGIFCIVLPEVSPAAACFSCGIALTAYGVIKLIGYFSDDLFCLAFQYDLGFGLSMIVLGAIIMVLNVRIQEHIQPIVGLLILLDGMLKIQTSKDARKFGLETWYQLLILAVLAGALGAAMVVMAFVEKSSHVVNGFALLAEGIMNHMLVNKTVLPEHSRTVSDHG
jgi:uncharacterized membrane protein HdeD (DUF308 family)